jgi:hypothetical protein
MLRIRAPAAQREALKKGTAAPPDPKGKGSGTSALPNPYDEGSGVSTAPNPEGEGDAHVRPKGVGAPKDLTK